MVLIYLENIFPTYGTKMNDYEKMIWLCQELDIAFLIGTKNGVDKVIIYTDDYDYTSEMTYDQNGKLIDERFFKILPLDK